MTILLKLILIGGTAHIREDEMNNTITEKQKQCIEHLRKRYGDNLLLHYAKRGKWSEHNFNLDVLTKEEAQRIIKTAPPKVIHGIYAPISYVQSL